MERALPDWQPFELDPEEAPPLEFSGMSGPVLVLLASPGTEESGWAPHATACIARGRVAAGGRLLLADLALERPSLHRLLGVPDGEGMSDALLFGASLRRISRRVDRDFLFAPAGTAVADSSAVAESPLWTPMIDGFRRADGELFLYLPWEAPGRDALLGRARNVVVFAEAHEVERLSSPDVPGLRIGAVLGPPEEGEDGGGDDSPGVIFGGEISPTALPDPGVLEELPADRLDRLFDGVEEAGREGEGEGDRRVRVPLDTGGASDSTEVRGGRSRLVLLVVVLVLVVAAATAVLLLGLVELPWLPRLGTGPSAGLDAGGGTAELWARGPLRVSHLPLPALVA